MQESVDTSQRASLGPPKAARSVRDGQGIRTRIVVPCPGWLSISSWPPIREARPASPPDPGPVRHLSQRWPSDQTPGRCPAPPSSVPPPREPSGAIHEWPHCVGPHYAWPPGQCGRESIPPLWGAMEREIGRLREALVVRIPLREMLKQRSKPSGAPSPQVGAPVRFAQ